MKFHFSKGPRPEYRETPSTLKILRAAKRIFIRDGGDRFSSRGVAKEAKLSLGAVQHFFPTKHELLAAMLEYVVNEYESEYQKLCDRLPMNGETRLLGVLDILIADIWKRDTRKFFFGFWALACHNPAASTLFGEMYSYQVRRIGAFLGAAQPGLAESRCEELAIQIVAMTDGLMLFSAPRGKPFATAERMKHMVKETVLRLLTQ
jgi:AcrR family transcriptional regulator